MMENWNCQDLRRQDGGLRTEVQGAGLEASITDTTWLSQGNVD